MDFDISLRARTCELRTLCLDGVTWQRFLVSAYMTQTSCIVDDFTSQLYRGTLEKTTTRMAMAKPDYFREVRYNE